MYIGGSDTLPQPLSRTEEAQLIAQMDQGDFPSDKRSLSGTYGW